MRQVRESDLPALLTLAKTGNFINLPPNEPQLREFVENALATFQIAAAGEAPADYDRARHVCIFVLENPAGEVVGTSGIRCGMGDPEHPNLSFQLLKVVRHSPSLTKTDKVSGRAIISGHTEHIYAVLFEDSARPTELGGNVLRVEERGGGLGKLLSYCRFQFMHRHPTLFSDRIMAEMMAPLDPYNDGNTFWRHMPRKFINLSYENADRLSTVRERREFMYNLLPATVNLSLLEDEVLEFLGKVGPYTRGAAAMLTDIGFRYVHRVDPFDAGAHLETRLSTMDRLRTEHATVAAGAAARPVDSIVSAYDPERGFRAVRTAAAVAREGVALKAEALHALGVSEGDAITHARLDFKPLPGVPHDLPEIDLDEAYLKLHPEANEGRSMPVSIGPKRFAEVINAAIKKIKSEFPD
ncbi:MAG: arginine N-succinyltransferase [Planctomycetota bacterium]